jgi:proteasome lid subunit RPN8/RPN11
MSYERQPTDLKQSDLKKAFEHAQAEYPKEACGVFTHSSGYIACKNVAAKPEDDFTMLEYKQIAANEGDVIAIFHSHPNDMRCPSAEDMRVQISTALPWGIASLNGKREITDCFFWGSDVVPPLIGREYRSGAMDCYSIIRDVYKLWYSIDLPEYPRDEGFFERGEDKYMEGFSSAGFELITPNQLMPGDVILGSVLGRGMVNHGAVVLNEKEIIHHTLNSLSRRDSLSKWFRHLNICLRHKEFKDNGGPPMPPKVV